MLIDAHAHLPLNPEISFCFLNGTKPEDWQKISETVSQNKKTALPFFGLHPWFIEETYGLVPRWLSLLESYLRAHPHAGVGEIGLDGVKALKNPDLNLKIQTEVFKVQLELARSLNRPVSLHCVKKTGLLIEILSEFKDLTLMIHGFSGSKETAEILLKQGVYFSFSPRQIENLKKLRNTIPLSQIFLESDGKKEVQENFISFYQEISQIFSVSLEEFLFRMKQNAEIFTHQKITG